MGEPDPFAMLARMSARTYRLWLKYEEVEPLDPMLALGLGTISSLLYNANRGENADALRPEDFFPQLKQPEREPTPEQAAEQSKRMHWKMKLAAWKTGNVFMPSVKPPG